MRQYRGQGEFFMMMDASYSIEQCVKYHAQDVDYVSQREITLTQDQALNIEKRMINRNHAIAPFYFPYGAYAISSVLDEYGLQGLYYMPGSLEEAVKEIEDKKGQVSENN